MATIEVLSKVRKHTNGAKTVRSVSKFWTQEQYQEFARFYQGSTSISSVADRFKINAQEVARRATFLRNGGVELKKLGGSRIDYKAINQGLNT